MLLLIRRMSSPHFLLDEVAARYGCVVRPYCITLIYYKNTGVDNVTTQFMIYVCVVPASALAEFDFPAEILPVAPFDFSYVCLKFV